VRQLQKTEATLLPAHGEVCGLKCRQDLVAPTGEEVEDMLTGYEYADGCRAKLTCCREGLIHVARRNAQWGETEHLGNPTRLHRERQHSLREFENRERSGRRRQD